MPSKSVFGGRGALPRMRVLEDAAMASPDSPAADREAELWLKRLRATGPERDVALTDLHALLLRAARFEVGRRHAGSTHLRGGDQDDLAQQSADDALVAVLGKLDSFRGDSRFTTWAAKFAILEASVKARRRAWQHREITLEPEAWTRLAPAVAAADPDEAERLRAIAAAIREALSPHQREILVAIALNDVPIDVLAERRNTTRGAIYKTLHDGRRKLRSSLLARGFGSGAYAEAAAS